MEIQEIQNNPWYQIDIPIRATFDRHPIISTVIFVVTMVALAVLTLYQYWQSRQPRPPQIFVPQIDANEGLDNVERFFNPFTEQPLEDQAEYELRENLLGKLQREFEGFLHELNPAIETNRDQIANDIALNYPPGWGREQIPMVSIEIRIRENQSLQTLIRLFFNVFLARRWLFIRDRVDISTYTYDPTWANASIRDHCADWPNERCRVLGQAMHKIYQIKKIQYLQSIGAGDEALRAILYPYQGA